MILLIIMIIYNRTEGKDGAIIISCGMTRCSCYSPLVLVRRPAFNMDCLCQCTQSHKEPLHYKSCQHRQQPWMELE